LQILEDGRTIEVSVTGCEGAVGLLSIFCTDRSTNWVQVSAPGTAIKITRDALEKETRGSEWANSVFFSSIQDRIQQLSQKVACNAHHSVEERFSTWLLMLEERSGTSRLKLTHEHVARVLGVYRPSVTCIAQRMRDAGLIDYVRGYVVILDRDGLRKRCCGCYRELSRPDSIENSGPRTLKIGVR
jgi:CRP-like cAMP-binding protein